LGAARPPAAGSSGSGGGEDAGDGGASKGGGSQGDGSQGGGSEVAATRRSNTSAGAAMPRAGTIDRAEGAEARALVPAPIHNSTPAAAHARLGARCATGE